MLSNELLSALASQGAAFALILYVLSRDVGTAGCQGSASRVQFFAFFFYGALGIPLRRLLSART